MRDEVLVPALLKVIRIWEVLRGVTQRKHYLNVTGQIRAPAALSPVKGSQFQMHAEAERVPDHRIEQRSLGCPLYSLVTVITNTFLLNFSIACAQMNLQNR